MKKIIFSIFLLSLLLILSSCWDRNEIEEIGFLLAVGLDPLEEEEQKTYEERYRKETGHVPSHKHHGEFYKSTFQIAVPSNIKTEQGGGSGQAFHNMTSIGMTNFKINRNFSARSSRVINFEHLKVLIIHQELARRGIIEHLIDFFIRDHEMRRKTKVFISEEKTTDILSDEHPLENIVAISVSDISDNHPRVLGMVEPADIGKLSQYVIGQTSYILPRIVHHGEGGVKIGGAAVFRGKTNEMIGWLGEEEARAYNWITNSVYMSALEIPYENDQIFVYENLSAATTIEYEKKNGKDHFQIEVKTEGAFVENWIHAIEINDQATLEKLEEAISAQIEKQITRLLEKMQKEYHVDIFELYKYVKQKDYNYWKKAKGTWDGENGGFSKATFDVKAEVQIRHYMLNEKLEDQ
ncbi:Ger(x)C family spore germination protein [Caldalkalibacillus mannanilyticus]|uniref:Ger(x)C family spore germination protein n=1 Tax=Caldalkalibacillus mannanilyticus TaxID=1418 RepID=UPI00046943DA|nr:Ger(x)C family spore germination protein [Caldalkalibacillus mannanilyticus]